MIEERRDPLLGVYWRDPSLILVWANRRASEWERARAASSNRHEVVRRAAVMVDLVAQNVFAQTMFSRCA